MNIGFKIDNTVGSKHNMTYNKVVTFYNDNTGKVEAEYYYLNNYVNWLLSWGFTKDSLNALRKSQSNKTKKPYFSFEKGWFNQE